MTEAATQTEATGTTATTATGDATGQQQNGGTDDRKFSQADIDAIVRDRLDREKKKADQAATKIREDAEAKALLEQQKFQELAEKRQAKITELEAQVGETETVREKAERYEKALKSHLDTQRKGLPKSITDLLDRLDVTDQLEWLAVNRDELAGTTNGQNGKAAVTPTPKVSGPQTEAQLVEKTKDEMRRSGKYAI